MDWVTSEVVALAAVIVTGLSIAVNAWLAKRRITHEDTLQKSRLAQEVALHESRLVHERAEGVRTTAATAYGDASAVLSAVNHFSVYDLSEDLAGDTEARARQMLAETTGSLGFISALGWNAKVRDTASALSDALSKVFTRWRVTARTIAGSSTPEDRMLERLEDSVDTALSAMETYRKAVAGE